jgi:hypothetical protein
MTLLASKQAVGTERTINCILLRLLIRMRFNDWWTWAQSSWVRQSLRNSRMERPPPQTGSINSARSILEGMDIKIPVRVAVEVERLWAHTTGWTMQLEVIQVISFLDFTNSRGKYSWTSWSTRNLWDSSFPWIDLTHGGHALGISS